METCEICGGEAKTLFTVTFKSQENMAPLHICRKCQGKLVLGLPKNPTMDQIKVAINKLSEEASEAPRHYGRRR